MTRTQFLETAKSLSHHVLLIGALFVASQRLPSEDTLHQETIERITTDQTIDTSMREKLLQQEYKRHKAAVSMAGPGY